MHAPSLHRGISPRQKSIPLSRARFFEDSMFVHVLREIPPVSRIFYQTHLALVRITAEWREWRKRRLAPHDRALVWCTPRHPSSFSIFPLFPWMGSPSTKASVASMLNHL